VTCNYCQISDLASSEGYLLFFVKSWTKRFFVGFLIQKPKRRNSSLENRVLIILVLAILILPAAAQESVNTGSVLKELNNIKDDSYSIDLTGLDTPRSNDMERIEIIYPFGDVDGYCVNVWCPPREYLSSYNVLEVAAGTTAEVARRLFANPQVDVIRVMQQMDVGLDDPIKAVQIEVKRDKGIDWGEAREQIKNSPENAFEIFGPCNVYIKGSSGYNRPARYECNE
jgi:hypothetical protein